MSKIRILIADDVEETRQVIIKLLSFEADRYEVVGEATNGEEVIKMIPKCNPHIILMDINMPILNGLEATEKVTEKYPNIAVIIMSVQTESEYLKRAMFSGAKEYVIKPLDYDALIRTIDATYSKNKKLVDKKINEVTDEKKSKIISFYSSKGGVGKTVLAANYAIVYGQTYKKKSIVIDLDVQYGDISILYNMHTEKTILDIVDDAQYESYAEIMPYISKINEHVDVILAPRNPEGGEYISKDVVSKMIKILQSHYDLIIIDTGVNFNEITLCALDLSDKIMFVSNMELSSIKNTKLGLGVMRTLNYDDDKINIIINSANNKFGINEKELKEVFEREVYAYIPEDIKVVRSSINKGVPIALEGKTKFSKFYKSLKNLCQRVEV